MTICILRYKTQCRSQEVEVEGQTILSSWLVPLCLWKWTNLLGWIEGKAQTEDAKCPKFEVEAQIESETRNWAGKGSGERARWSHLQKTFENSYFKPCNLVDSSSENPSFPSSGSWNLSKMGTDLISIPAKFSYLGISGGSVVNPPVRSGANSPSINNFSEHFYNVVLIWRSDVIAFSPQKIREMVPPPD